MRFKKLGAAERLLKEKEIRMIFNASMKQHDPAETIYYSPRQVYRKVAYSFLANCTDLLQAYRVMGILGLYNIVHAKSIEPKHVWHAVYPGGRTKAFSVNKSDTPNSLTAFVQILNLIAQDRSEK